MKHAFDDLSLPYIVRKRHPCDSSSRCSVNSGMTFDNAKSGIVSCDVERVGRKPERRVDNHLLWKKKQNGKWTDSLSTYGRYYLEPTLFCQCTTSCEGIVALTLAPIVYSFFFFAMHAVEWSICLSSFYLIVGLIGRFTGPTLPCP